MNSSAPGRSKVRTRISILLMGGFSFFLLWFTCFGIYEYSRKLEDLAVEEGTISGVIYNSDVEHRILKKDIVHSALDIFVQDKALSVRLSEHQEYWKYLKDLRVTGRHIRYYYHYLRRQNHYVYNPSQLEIDNVVLIDFDSERKKAFPYFLLMLFFNLVTGLYMVIAIKSYRQKYLAGDKMLIAERKYLKLIGKWLTE